MEGRGQARGRGSARPATSFQALGAEHAESLKGGEERADDSSSDDDSDSEEEVELVPSTQQQPKKKQQQQSASAPSKALKGKKRRETRKGKWTHSGSEGYPGNER